jgi:hypothetical protein
MLPTAVLVAKLLSTARKNCLANVDRCLGGQIIVDRIEMPENNLSTRRLQAKVTPFVDRFPGCQIIVDRKGAASSTAILVAEAEAGSRKI